ncbi:MAG: SgcJ/EcaC family oxidoreductase [Polyangiaceae bacterium]|nr:SgcJ/EcaC family oxidoreductase [Polyangiaceae bacterium]
MDHTAAGCAALRDLARRFTDAFNRDDLDAVMEFFAEDAVYVTYDDREHRGKRAIRDAFVPQFRGDFGAVRFHMEDVIVDEPAGKVITSWRCQHHIDDLPGLPLATQVKRALFRGIYGRAFGWHGLDVLHFEGGLLREKRSYSKALFPLARRDPARR